MFLEESMTIWVCSSCVEDLAPSVSELCARRAVEKYLLPSKAAECLRVRLESVKMGSGCDPSTVVQACIEEILSKWGGLNIGGEDNRRVVFIYKRHVFSWQALRV